VSTPPTTDADLWRFISHIHATHILSSSALENDHQFLTAFLRRYPANFNMVYKNADFELYPIRDRIATSNPAP